MNAVAFYRSKTGAPRVPAKHAVMFCTCSGPHTGLREEVMGNVRKVVERVSAA